MPAVVGAISEHDESEEACRHTKEQNAVVTPEWHDDSGALVDHEGFHVSKSSGFPNADLPVTHLTETSRGDAIVLSHPDHSGAFDTAMAFCDTNGLTTGAGIKETKFLVSARGCKNSAGHVECKRLNGITVSVQSGARTRRISEVPEFDKVLAGCSCDNVGGSWMPNNLTDFLWAHVDPCDGLQVVRFPTVRGPAIKEAVRDFPKERSAIFGGGSDESVVGRRPSGVENSCRVRTSERNDVRELRRYVILA